MAKGNKNQVAKRLLQAVVVLTALTLVAQLSSCASPAYYWQAASGHLSLMHARQGVKSAIEAGNLDETTTAKLRLSQEIRSFAIDQLGLPDNGSYSEFVQTGRDAVVWNVVAAPEFSLAAKTWCFPVAGCVPYRGYFEKTKAEHFAGKLARKGLEVSVSPATAYSTLGWFDDPLLDTMWNRSDARFAGLIFHELAHQQLYVKGDTRFNESYASFVETVGVKHWLQSQGRLAEFERWQELAKAERDFSNLLVKTRDELAEIYGAETDASEMRAGKQAAFERMQQDYDEIVNKAWGGQDYFGGWFSEPPNNARFALLDSYQGGNCAFASLFAQANSNIHEFHALAAEKSALPAADRQTWLEQACTGIAPGVEL